MTTRIEKVEDLDKLCRCGHWKDQHEMQEECLAFVMCSHGERHRCKCQQFRLAMYRGGLQQKEMT